MIIFVPTMFGDSCGLRIYDDLTKTYIDNWPKIPASDEEIIFKAFNDIDNTLAAILFDVCEEEDVEIKLNEKIYKWEDIERICVAHNKAS